MIYGVVDLPYLQALNDAPESVNEGCWHLRIILIQCLPELLGVPLPLGELDDELG